MQAFSFLLHPADRIDDVLSQYLDQLAVLHVLHLRSHGRVIERRAVRCLHLSLLKSILAFLASPVGALEPCGRSLLILDVHQVGRLHRKQRVLPGGRCLVHVLTKRRHFWNFPDFISLIFFICNSMHFIYLMLF